MSLILKNDREPIFGSRCLPGGLVFTLKKAKSLEICFMISY